MELQPARAEVTPRAGTWLDTERLRSAVTGAGFRPGALRYTVAGTLTEWQGRPALRLPGSGRIVLLQPQPNAPAAYDTIRRALGEAAGKTVEIEGECVEAPSHELAATLRVVRWSVSGATETPRMRPAPR